MYLIILEPRTREKLYEIWVEPPTEYNVKLPATIDFPDTNHPRHFIIQIGE